MSEISTRYQVTGMTCGHCEMSVREEVGEIPGVRSVEVSHESGALRVVSEQGVDDAAVLAAVTEAGYSAVRAG
jgi:copper chaperone